MGEFDGMQSIIDAADKAGIPLLGIVTTSEWRDRFARAVYRDRDVLLAIPTGMDPITFIDSIHAIPTRLKRLEFAGRRILTEEALG